ncbi:hypothetical protein ACIBTV_27745 [Micromonospora sp. NPDC049366]|uniref:hypothetical protein n=1 Tax=Micromonospora sp. NPDC049366 TaxID=3364271 RepID=UPI0037A07ED2
MTAGEGPDNGWAVHDCGYAPLLTGGKLVKKHDPAWQLPEVGADTRNPETLQRFVGNRAHHDLHHRQPGYGLGYHHSRDARGEVSGYPDCHMWAPRPGAHMWRELKRMGKAPRPEQAATLTGLAATGADVGVWWPCCWYSGRIDRELAELAGQPRIGQHWAPGLPPQPGDTGYVPWSPNQSPAAAPVPRQRREQNRGLADRVAPRSPATPRPPAALPGADLPAGFGEHGVAGYVVPLPADPGALAAAGELDRWLRDHGFPPAVAPYPVRIAVATAGGGVAVQCRAGGPHTPRVWRWAPHRRHLDSAVSIALGADVICGPAGFTLDLLGDAVPLRDVPAT